MTGRADRTANSCTSAPSAPNGTSCNAIDDDCDGSVSDSGTADATDMQHRINGYPITGMLGSQQCAQYEAERCPEGCSGIYGFELDEANDCTLPRALLDCSTEEVFADEVVCRVSKRTGRTYRVSVIALARPGYEGWEPAMTCG